ncbi:MAG: serpin family protein [Clostridiales bacterium]|nr:serpin family protein [Clostridiales bacterium]
MFKKLYAALVCLLLRAMIFSGCAETVQAADLMEGITQSRATRRNANEQFISAQMDFAAELFKSAADCEKNSLISPLSVQLALSMTANGANGKTLEEMEAALGGIPIETLNEYLYGYVLSLPSEEKCKLQTANSIWFRDTERLNVEKTFLQTNADYYGAQAYKSPFNEQTVKDVNLWVKQKTDGMIPEMLQTLSEKAQMLLINAVAFDGEWENKYKNSDIHKGIFTSLNGEKQTVSMMTSNEIRYLNDGKAEGFIKDYSGGKYRFAALLPHEGTDLWAYVSSLTGETLLKTLKEAEACNVEAIIPKFSCECTYDNMKKALIELGMPTAFDGDTADFSRLGHSDNGNLYIGSVLHKTHIDITEKGTKAGAATVVEMLDGAMTETQPIVRHSIALDRPFLYLIVDAQTNLPIFIGTVTDIA